jgi:hypothetical protein
MRKTAGEIDSRQEKRAQAKRQIGETKISDLNSLPQIREALAEMLDYLDLPYQP